MVKNLLKLFFVSTILFCGCKRNPVEPTKNTLNTNCTFSQDNRNYRWRIDTVAVFPSTLGGIWAFSDSDAYVMGYIIDKKSQNFYVALHWNGTKWDTSVYGNTNDIKHYSNDIAGDDHYFVSVGYYHIGHEKPGLAEFDNTKKKWNGYQFLTPGQLYSVWTDGKGYFVASGDNGMVYTKDGYNASWVYEIAPTDFTLLKVSGVSKNELYFLGAESTVAGDYYAQLWRYNNKTWTKLLDNKDTTGTPIRVTEFTDHFAGMGVYRCQYTDSLYLYLTSYESFEIRSKGISNEFTKINLATRGLPFSSLRQTAGRIAVFSPNDYWIGGLEYRLYHWTGTEFKKIEPIPSFPYGNLWGGFLLVHKSKTGKLWITLANNPQLYTVLQGVPY